MASFRLPRAAFLGLVVIAITMGVSSLKSEATGTGSSGKNTRIERVVSPGGIEVWLVEDHLNPVISMEFGFRGGSAQDPQDRAGLANFVSGMLDEGAGKLKSQEFQARVEELAVRLSFDAGRDSFYGTFQTLTRNKDEAFEMLRLAINEPRFDKVAVERIRTQIVTGLKFDEKDANKIATREWFRTAFPNHPYGRTIKGTAASVKTITRKDLTGYVGRNFARDTLKVAVVGDIDARSIGAVLDKVFGALPAKADLAEVPEVTPVKGPNVRVIDFDNPQSVVQFGHGGIKRKDKDFVPAYVLNYIIGGGGFSSLLTEEVREKRGLAYSVYSYLYPLKHGAVYLGGVATKNERVKESLDVIQAELEKIARNGPTKEQLDSAKRYLTGSYALRFDTGRKIAGQLAAMQIAELDIDYIDKRNDMVAAVTMEDVLRAAKRLLKPGELLVTIVGKPVGLKTKVKK